MKKSKIAKKIFISGLILLTTTVLLYISYNRPVSKTNSTIELTTEEINEYEGQNLSSINNFRENSIEGIQYIDKENYKLKITGLENDINYSYNDLINSNQSYKKVVTLNCVEGWSVKILWEGFLFKDLIDRQSIPEKVNTIIIKASDGYSTSFPIDYLYNNDILIAYKMNDVELPPERGFPLQLVAESKYGYKWIKWITEIEFSTDENYRGFWESRGYSNDGDLNKDFFE